MTTNINTEIETSRSLPICVGETTKNNRVSNASPTWEQLCRKIETPTRTSEAYTDYCAMDSDIAGRIKDVGYFIGGPSLNGTRNAKNITTRNLITLDLDHAPKDYRVLFEQCVGGLEFCIYSTHKHSPGKPRLRMLFPLSRTVSGAEYKAVARKLAQKIGIEYCDEASYVVPQAMYWPSCSQDAEYVFYINKGEWVDPDKVLAEYKNWKDTSEWPVSSREKNAPPEAVKKAENPLEKTGLVGLWCRTYSIEDVISKFLSDVYEPTDDPSRYTYIAGTTYGGAIVYNNGLFLYSHHEKDPVSKTLVNAFDLVRIHKYGELDEQN
jgi:putative DNA primase/helicase